MFTLNECGVLAGLVVAALTAGNVRAQEVPIVREHYVVPDADNWIYRLNSSKDGGRSWDEGSTEFTFH